MTTVTPDDVHKVLAEFIQDRLRTQGQDQPRELPQDCDLLLSGLIDSLGLLEMITAINDHFGREIDFETMDPEKITVVGPFCRFVAEKLNEG